MTYKLDSSNSLSIQSPQKVQTERTFTLTKYGVAPPLVNTYTHY